MTIIETKRLILRELSMDDKLDLKKVLSDPISMKYYPHPFTEQEVESWISWNLNNYKKHKHGLWAVVLKEENILIGDCGITIQNIEGECLPEIGFHIISNYCNKGYATEAAFACKQYGFEQLNYSKIYSYTLLENKASQKVAQKIGMQFLKSYEDQQGTHVVQIASKSDQWI